jgi:hypothetical protein
MSRRTESEIKRLLEVAIVLLVQILEAIGNLPQKPGK